MSYLLDTCIKTGTSILIKKPFNLKSFFISMEIKQP